MDEATWRELVGLSGPNREQQSWSTPLGPDFPESAGDRERAKFRKSEYARLVTLAVVNDDGSRIDSGTLSTEQEILLELKAIRFGIQFMLMEFSAKWAGHDLRRIAASE